MKPVAVEDLLGRPQAVLDRPAMESLIKGARVLVTGAGGTIGSELVRQIAALGPGRLDLVDNSEFNLYSIDLEMGEAADGFKHHAHLADVRDRTAMAAVFAEARPNLVFHAAALKHVPIVESHVAEGVLTNIGGSRIVADLCRDVGARKMVLISTDKAVNPTNAMGATKRVAESYCQALDRAPGDAGCQFITVRFGNVLGSTGSVVPLFERQLAAGGPPDRHPSRHHPIFHDHARSRGAGPAGLRARHRESRWDFRSGYGRTRSNRRPGRANDRLAGKRPYDDIDIRFVGLRDGEKLFEELFHDAESLAPTGNDAIRLAMPPRGGPSRP